MIPSLSLSLFLPSLSFYIRETSLPLDDMSYWQYLPEYLLIDDQDPTFMEGTFSIRTSRHDYLASLQTAQGRVLWRYLFIPEGSALHILC